MSNTKAPGLTPAEQRTANPERLVFLTDGAIAIIMTILALEIRVPEFGSGQTLTESLIQVRPSFISFVISFLLVGMLWMLHKRTFNQVRYIDHISIWLSLLFLLALALVPYASSALGEHSSDPAALQLYGAVLIAAALLHLGLDAYFQSHPGLLWVKSSKESRRIASMQSWAIIVVYVIAMVTASWNTTVSLILYFLIPVLHFVTMTALNTNSRQETGARDLD